MILSFTEWLPDLADFGLGTRAAMNVIPEKGGYRPVKDLVSATDALDAKALGGLTARDSDGNVYIYAGDATKLYEAISGSFTAEGTGYSVATGDVWEFVQFGNTVIATDFTDDVQSIAVGGGGAGSFATHITSTDSSGTEPKFKHIGIIRDFLVGGFVNDVDGVTSNRVRWSGINTSNDFNFDNVSTNQSDKQDLPEGGRVQKIVGSIEYGIVFQESMVRRMDYIGPPIIFSIQPIAKSIGTPIPGSVVSYDRRTFYISEEGFSIIVDGTAVDRIGAEKVDRTFWNQFDVTNAPNVSATIDPRNKLYMVAFPGEGSTGGNPNKIWFYHWETNRFAEAEIETELLLSGLTQGQNVDSGLITNIDTDADASTSIDSDKFKGGELRTGAFKTDHKLYNFIGDNLAATITTVEENVIPGRLATVNSSRPLVDGGTPTITPITRDRLADAVSTGTAVSMDSTGDCKIRSTARYHRFQTDVPAGAVWSHAQGVELLEDAVSDAGSR